MMNKYQEALDRIKNKEFSSLYVISEPEFEKFLLECLPKYLNKEKLDDRK